MRAFGRLQLLSELIPVDVEALMELRKAQVRTHAAADPVLEFIAAWVKDPVFIRQLAKQVPAPNSSAAELRASVHQAVRAISQRHLHEAGACIHGGRHTGLAFCLRWLGLASKTGGTRQDFKGGVPFEPFQPRKVARGIGSGGCEFEFGKSLLGLEALMAGFRSAKYPSTFNVVPWNELRDHFHNALAITTKKYSMGLLGDYAAPHILRKFILLNGDLPPMTVTDMETLMPDEQKLLKHIPTVLRDRGRLAKFVHCGEMYITCFNCISLRFVSISHV